MCTVNRLTLGAVIVYATALGLFALVPVHPQTGEIVPAEAVIATLCGLILIGTAIVWLRTRYLVLAQLIYGGTALTGTLAGLLFLLLADASYLWAERLSFSAFILVGAFLIWVRSR